MVIKPHPPREKIGSLSIGSENPMESNVTLILISNFPEISLLRVTFVACPIIPSCPIFSEKISLMRKIQINTFSATLIGSLCVNIKVLTITEWFN